MEEKNTKEVNLLDILTAVWNWIVKAVMSVVSLIGKTLQMLFRHKILVIIILLLALGISQYFSRSSNRKYNVDAMAVLYGVQAKTVMQVGNQLSTSSPLFELTSLAHKLGVSDSVSKKIDAIKFYNVIDYKNDSVPDKIDFGNSHSLSDTLNVRMRDHVYVRLRLYGTDHAQDVGESVLNFLNNNEAIRAEYNTWRRSLEEKIVVSKVEARRIDSLANIKYFEENKANIRFDNNRLMIGNQQTQLFYGDMLFLQKNISESEGKLAEAKAPVVLPSGFIVNPNATNGRVKKGVEGLIVGFVLSILLAFFLENYKKWIKYLNNK